MEVELSSLIAAEEKARMEILEMLLEHSELIYEALRLCYRASQTKYRNLVSLCDAKRTYEVPPEYSGVINVYNRARWSPTDTEMARVIVACTVADPKETILYSDLVARLNCIVSVARPHIYRSLKTVLLYPAAERGGLIRGIRLR